MRIAALAALALILAATAAAAKGPSPTALLGYLKAHDKAAKLGESALLNYLPKEIAICPKFAAVPAAYWGRARADILTQGTTWVSDLSHRTTEAKLARNYAIVALTYEGAPRTDLLGITHRLVTDDTSIATLDANFQRSFQNLSNRSCGAAQAAFVSAKPVALKRILVGDDLGELSTFLKTHP